MTDQPDPPTGATAPTAPVLEVLGHHRDDSVRLRELLAACSALHTWSIPQLVLAAQETWTLASGIAAELGLNWRNPPIPDVCKKVAGDCGCGGKC